MPARPGFILILALAAPVLTMPAPLRAQAPAPSQRISRSTGSRPLPKDVRADWARKGVQSALDNGILSADKDGKFHGEQKVNRTDAVIALAKLAKAVEAGTWRASRSAPVSDKMLGYELPVSWKQQTVNRYVLAAILTRFGDFAANGLTRPGPTDKDVAKSETLPDNVKPSVPPSHPAYESLVYLTSRRMIQPKSVLLHPDGSPLRGSELSTALWQMGAGLADRLTDLGHDEEGDTVDINTKKKK